VWSRHEIVAEEGCEQYWKVDAISNWELEGPSKLFGKRKMGLIYDSLNKIIIVIKISVVFT
jgi:hypothetical protein